VERSQFIGSRYTKGEFSKVSYAYEMSWKLSSKENDENPSSSSHGSFHHKERAEPSSHHHNNIRDNEKRYSQFQHLNIHFDYNHFFNDERKTWHRKTCTFCGLHNDTFSMCWKRMVAHNRMRCERPAQQ